MKIDEVLVNAMMNKVMAQFEEHSIDVDIACLRAVASVNQTFLDLYIRGINKQFGTVENYIKTKLGITEQMISELRSNYLR